MRPHHLIIVLILSAICVGQDVRINEIHTGPDWIEICNLGSVTVDLSGWNLLYFEDTGNPGGSLYAFPGSPGSGAVVLAPDECLVVTDSQSLAYPVVPPGTLLFYFGSNILWNSGEAGSCLLADENGNGVDYFAFGNPNLMLAPFEVGALVGPGPATPTTFSTPSPDFGTPNTDDVHVRHSRMDTDQGSDWTMISDGMESPGLLNSFQSPAGPVGGVPVNAVFQASTLSGTAPLNVDFTNLSAGSLELTSVIWLFDATGPPPFPGAISHNASYSYTVPGVYHVLLTISDGLGVSTSAVSVITVYAPADVVPVASLPYIETFEGQFDPATGLSILPARGWSLELADPTSRIRTIDPRSTTNTSPIYSDASPTSGPTVAILDSSVDSHQAVNQFSLHVDMLTTGPFRFRCNLLRQYDENTPFDGVFISDGVSPPVILFDWQSAIVLEQVWTPFEQVIDAAFLATLGLTPGSDMTFRFSQQDDFRYESNDGLLIDEVELLTIPSPGPGHPCSPGVACLDFNNAVNANGNPVGHGTDPNGPHFAQVTPGQSLSMTFSGQPNQPIILLAGSLHPGLAVFPIGQVDIGHYIPAFPFVGGITIVGNGVNAPPGSFALFLNTGPAGAATMTFTMPSMPPGVLTSFQAIVANSSFGFKLTNAVQILVN